ncbi:MAG TPA: hypothetical protein VFU64_01450 [Gaiellaceae bacterium]|nr:hypothetical protein [Gaiellaceae bacterium]
MRRILVVVAALATVAVVVASPAAATTPTYALSGVETGLPQPAGGDESTSSFAGTAFSWSAGFATWTAHVTHHSLAACASLGDSCITGGDFSLTGASTISGQFESGSITLVSGSPVTCTSTTVYRVAGVVDLDGGGTATFTARLTHYQVKLFGSCVPYFATVKGTFG